MAKPCLTETSWTIGHQAPLSMGFARQEYWSVLPFPSPGDPPNPGMQPESPAGQVDSLLSHLGSPTLIYIQVGGEAVETMRDFILGEL